MNYIQRAIEEIDSYLQDGYQRVSRIHKADGTTVCLLYNPNGNRIEIHARESEIITYVNGYPKKTEKLLTHVR